MNIQVKCTLFLILPISTILTTVLCQLEQNEFKSNEKIHNFHQRRIRTTDQATNHFDNGKIPGVISLDVTSSEKNDFAISNLTAITMAPEIISSETKFTKKLVNDGQKNTDKGSSISDENHKNETNDKINGSNSDKSTIVPPSANNILNNLNSTSKILTPTIEVLETNFSRARALDIPSSSLEPTNSLSANLTDLSDVSMDENDKQVEGGEYIAHHNESNVKISPILLSSEKKCIEPNNKTYTVGETIVRGCTEKCICGSNGNAENCQPICQSPLVRAIGKSQDPFCHKQKIDDNECCAILICSSTDNSDYQSADTCNFVGNDNINKTIGIGQHIEDGCTRICTCQVGGVLNCKPRCSSDTNNDNDDDEERSNNSNLQNSNHDRCVKLEDPRDSCCTITYCDVSIGEHELIAPTDATSSISNTKTINNETDKNSLNSYLNNDQVKVFNSTAIKISLSSELININKTIVEISKNNHIWKQTNFNKEGIISNLEPASTYYIRIKTEDKNNKTRSTVSVVVLPPLSPKVNTLKDKSTNNLTTIKSDNKDACSYRGKLYEVGAEWYDECINFCVCEKGAKTQCVTIECPTDFGLDVLDPSCLDWETVPFNFVPKAPQCCPEEVRCRNNGSCIYEGIVYDNWSEIPNNITGCDKRCYCEMGKVSCQPACPPVPALPPDTLPCPSNQAALTKLPDDECCLHWICGSEINNNNYHTLMPEINSTVFVDDTVSSMGSPLTTNTVANGMKNNWQSSTIVDENHQKINQNNKIIPLSNLTSTIGIHNNKDNDDYGGITDVKQSIIPQYHDFNKSDMVNNFTFTNKPIKMTSGYNGPYNPNYKLPGSSANFDVSSNNNNHVKDKFLKTKSSETKKTIEPTKSYHNYKAQEEQYGTVTQSFPGPLAPDKLPSSLGSKVNFAIINNPTIKINNDNKTQFYQNSGEKISSNKHNKNKFTNIDGFNKQVTVSSNAHDYLSLLESSTKPEIPSIPVNPEKIKSDKDKFLQVKDKDNIPDELLHLINLHHPELGQESGLHKFNPQQILPVDQQPPPLLSNNHRIQTSPTKQHFGVPLPSLLSQQEINKNDKFVKPQIKAQKNENGEITSYHIHTQQIPSSPQQIEELLAHISQHDSNVNSFHNYPTSSPPLPLPSPPSLSSSSPLPSLLTHLNHPFAGIQAPIKPDLPDTSPGHIYSTLGFPLHGDDLAASGYFNKVSGLRPSLFNNEIIIKSLDAINDSTIRILFTVPAVLVGRYGRVELRYTNEKTNSDPSTWRSQIFIPPNDLIATPQLEFELDGLEPSTEYKLKVTVNLRSDQNINSNPSSKIYTVKTLDRYTDEDKHTLIKATTASTITMTTKISLPPQILIDAGLKVIETNFSWIKVEWKKFTEFEIQFIDGIQLRYKEYDSKVYTTTPLIHRAVTSWIIEGLKPATTYQVGISIIPFPGQNTELYSEKTIQITTSIEPDPYSFDVKVEIKMIKSQEVELSWSGVPYPEDKYVNIYRAIYQSDSGKGDTSTFKIAKRDSPAKTIISDLKPGTRYRLWLEIYLTNGKIKKSNVQDFITKPGVDLLHTASSGNIYQSGKYGITASAAAVSIPALQQENHNNNNNSNYIDSNNNNNYYGPLVIVAIVASLAILSTLILLMMLMKRRSSNKADISPSRKTTGSAAYDNPSYKVEIQQETMDL